MDGRACQTCGTANEADARFCEGCGGPLDRRCDACGTPASASARFCRSCGAALGVGTRPPPVSPTRKTVTVLFADLAGSTAFEEQIDPETAREVLGGYHELLRVTAERHHAGVVKYIGDGFMAVWGVPEIGPEDADRAVAAAAELQQRFVDLAARVNEQHQSTLALRVAVNTGEVVVGAGDADLVGDAVNVAARLESTCPQGQVVVGEETWRATRGHHRYEPLGLVQVKGRAASVPVYQWAARRSEPADSIAFVGRGDEFHRLRGALGEAVAHGAARLVTVVGDPGVGKTRLAAEFAAHSGVAVLDVRCATEGSVALAPLVDTIRTRDLDVDIPTGVGERDRILRGLADLDTGAATSVEETFWALRRYIEVLAAGQPLVVVVDDVQWADPLLLDFLEHLTQWVRDAAVLVLALTRPEIRDSRADLVSVGGTVSDAIRLRGLDPEATARLATHVVGAQRLPGELLDRLPESTGGNPLFVRELVGMLVHDGVLVPHPDGWRLTIDADAIAVPPTIQALLASRIERMNSADRRMLEVASVIGSDFFPSALSVLSGLDAATVRSALDRLRRHDLAAPSGAYLGDEPIWRFQHVLIRDVGYRRLLKSDRADLHERFADWVEAGGVTGAVDPEQLGARHTEAAHGYRRDLGLHDESTAVLALRSARGYLAAARRALDRDAVVSAGTQAARGAALAGAEPALRAELLQVACEAFLADGDVTAAAPLIDELEAVAGEALDPVAACFRCQFLVYTDPSRLREVDERLGGAIAEYIRRGDATGLAKAYRVRAGARARMGRVGDAELDLFEALIAARRGGDHRQITAVLGFAPNAALWGPSPVPKAGGRCLDVVRMQRMTTGAPSLEATSLRCLAILEVLRGRPDKARTMLADARTILGDLGLRHGLMETELHAGIVELMVGDPGAAEPHFRTALDGLDVLGVGADAGQAAALLARSVLAQGRVDEADNYATHSERIAGHNLKTAIAWRAVRAEILCAQGRHADAVALATEAVSVASGTDLVLDHAEACLALSRVLAAAGDGRGAGAARSRAESLYAAKEAALPLGRAPSAAAPTAEPGTTTRLSLSNRASAIVTDVARALIEQDFSPLFLIDEDAFVYEDRRSLKGDPIVGSGEFLEAAKRKFQQYGHFESRPLAVRGDTVALVSLRWWDDAGNETASLDLIEVSRDGSTMLYHGRFDADDFAGAYAEMERRYYAGEGREFAVNGAAVSRFVAAMSARDVEAARGVARADFRWLAAESALKPAARSVDEFFDWLGERDQQLSALLFCIPAMSWVSPHRFVALGDIRGTGSDGETYDWRRIYVAEYRDGKAVSTREFEADQEAEAFAYAEALIHRPSRLAVQNRCTEVARLVGEALARSDFDTAAACYATTITYVDHRGLHGGEIVEPVAMVAALRRLRDHYTKFDGEVLAVRGERLALGRYVCSDEAGNESAGLMIREIDENGRIRYEARYEDRDFREAYRELHRRYYAGEGAEFAGHGLVSTAVSEALNLNDIGTVRRLTTPDFRWHAPDSALKVAERTIDDMVAWAAERGRLVASQDSWLPVTRWLSPRCAVALVRITARGHDGEHYDWTIPFVSEFRDGLLASCREFGTEDDAFRHAEDVVAKETAPPELRNMATAASARSFAASSAGDLDAVQSQYSPRVVSEDRRLLGGDPFTGRGQIRDATVALRSQFSDAQTRTVAVRGDRLQLLWIRFSDDAGNQSSQCHVVEVDHQGLIVHACRFDGEDLEGAYRELETRYYAGEGRPFAANGMVFVAWLEAIQRLDLAAARSLSQPDFSWTCPPTALTAGTRSLDEFLAWQRQRAEQASSMHCFVPKIHWPSADVMVATGRLVAVNDDDAQYTWDRFYTCEFRDTLVAAVCEFDDEEAAVAYAAERTDSIEDSLAVRNRVSAASQSFTRALQDRDLEAAVAHFAEGWVMDDHRHFGGDPIRGKQEVRAALTRILAQYSHFESHPLAVRGDRLELARSRWWDDDGNVSDTLHVNEVDDDGLMVSDCRFDADDFAGAYAEMDRRYFAGEGAPFAEHEHLVTDYVLAINRGDWNTVFGELMSPDLHVENHCSSGFPDRSADDLRASLTELGEMLSSVRWWYSAVRWVSPSLAVSRMEREGWGRDGGHYTWTRILVSRVRAGRVEAIWEFDSDDQAAAFACAAAQLTTASVRTPGASPRPGPRGR